MFQHYQPWVIHTYGDSAKTKTITLRKYARIVRTLRGEETNSVENSKFRFWVKAKGFRLGQPPGYVAKPADGIVGSQTLSGAKDARDDPPLYVPTSAAKVSHAGAVGAALGDPPRWLSTTGLLFSALYRLGCQRFKNTQRVTKSSNPGYLPHIFV
ncbi:Zinc finger protein 454, partial [Gryllus bimaculatus]